MEAIAGIFVSHYDVKAMLNESWPPPRFDISNRLL